MDPREYIEEQIRKAYGDIPQQAIEAAQTTDEDPDQLFTEGAQCNIVADRYERSRSARQACLQANGTVCAICGFDFAKAYGAEFAGIIQVHHITPISEIGHEYQVDPVHDLIPVCPQLPRSPALKTRRNLHPRRAKGVTAPRRKRREQGPIMEKPTRYAVENKSRTQSERNAR